jgi:hypothetical protein
MEESEAGAIDLNAMGRRYSACAPEKPIKDVKDIKDTKDEGARS